MNAQKLKSVAVLFVFSWVAISFFSSYLQDDEPRAAQNQNALAQEFNNITPLSSTVFCDYRAGHKGQSAGVGGHFSTIQSFEQVRAHFDRELQRNGWKFYKEERVLDWGRDFGGKSLHYCKGEYTASLQYAGENAGYGWDYALDLDWRMNLIICS